MDFSGQLPMDVPRAYAIARCHSPEILQLVLPVTGTVSQVDDGHYKLLLTPNTPLLKTSLPGKLQVKAVEPGEIYELQSEARLWGLGGITLQARLKFSGEGNSCALSYFGTMTSSGMLARIIHPREAEIRSRVQDGFARLRQQIVQDAAQRS